MVGLWSRLVGGAVARLGHRPYLVVDSGEWVVGEIGRAIARNVRRMHGKRCVVVPLAQIQRLETTYRQVIHFCTEDVYSGIGHKLVHPSCRTALTFYHGAPDDPEFSGRYALVLKNEARLQKLIVSCGIMERRWMAQGFPPEKMVRIPIGIDLSRFTVPSESQRFAARRMFGMNPDCAVVGSFVKDGCGWGDGMDPKRIKGPDVLLDVVKELRRDFPVEVLLSGPARGYVMHGLERAGIPFRRAVVRDHSDMVACYHAVDVCLITSREEGGPKALIESMATGVPVVSTRVGMAADLIRNGRNGFVCEVDDRLALVESLLRLLSDATVRQTVAGTAIEDVKECDYPVVVDKHWREVYVPLLADCQQ
jgi:glycosyltransferase involved in cell wall biosynthesis